jgi:hypothetical protein
MWPMTVVPHDEKRELTSEFLAAVRDDQPSRALVFDRPDESFDDGDTAVLTHGTESLADTVSAAPLSETSRDELLAVIGDQVLRSGSRLPNHPIEKHGDSRRCRGLVEHGEPHDAT